MRRRASLRLLSAFLVLWLAFTGGLAALRPCPVHDAGTAMERDGTGPHGGAMRHGLAHHGDRRSPAHHHGGNGCTCIGTCCTSATLLPPVAIDVAFVETLTPVMAALPSPRAVFAPTLVEHARPPSVGPPTPTA